MRRAAAIFIFPILLIPSAHFAWQNRQMPQFAYLHDDGVLFVTAKSVATDSYRIASLPDTAYQTKFPPLFPWYLSVIWRLNPTFPDNLRLASLFSWLSLAAYLALAWAWYGQSGVTEVRAWLLVALLAVNPYVIWFGTSLFSDVFFTCWLLATVLVASRGGVRMALIAGLLGGCAYLSRTAGIALLVSVPAWMAWKKEWRRAAVFVAAMSPAVIGWMLWTRTHMAHTSDWVTIYYTDYIRYLLHNGIRDVPLILWKNVDQLLYAMGSMAMPRIYDSLPLKILTQVTAVAMISGTVRLVRRGFGLPYACFALVTAAILLVCNFPSTERYMVPVYPLLLAGLLAEIEHVAGMFKAAFRHRDFSQRAAAAIFASGVAAILIGSLALQFFMSFVFLQASVDESRVKLRDREAAYAWIAEHLPASATVLSYDDPLLYLYTGRHGVHRPLDPLWWYREDHASIQSAYRDLPAFCRSRGLEYVYFTATDLAREAGGDDQREVQRMIRESAELSPVFTAGIGTVYKVGPPVPAGSRDPVRSLTVAVQ